MLLPQIKIKVLYINNKMKIKQYIYMQFEQQQHKEITIFNPSSS